MAVEFITQLGEGLVGLWKITETTEELFLRLNPAGIELEHYLQFKNEGRKKEWLAVRLLLQAMKGEKAGIVYTQNGNPELVNSTGNISISHSSGFVTIFYHPVLQPGIDIELITRNVEKAAGKFLSAKELEDCTFNDQRSNKDLMLRWCAKEAVFKMVPFSDIDFATQILCNAQPLKTSEGMLTATFSNKADEYLIPLHFRLIGDLLMVFGSFKL
jgi:phosphopantetheinyl transferase (holo-ACP synthase)